MIFRSLRLSLRAPAAVVARPLLAFDGQPRVHLHVHRTPCGKSSPGPGVLARFVKVVLAYCKCVIIARLWVQIKDLSTMYSCNDKNIHTGTTKFASRALANAHSERTTTREQYMYADEHIPPSKSAACNLPPSCNSCAQSLSKHTAHDCFTTLLEMPAVQNQIGATCTSADFGRVCCTAGRCSTSATLSGCAEL